MSQLDHIRQKPNLRDCAVAATAMIANVTYDEAFAEAPGRVPRRGLPHFGTAGLLRRLTHVKWRYTDGWFRRLDTVCRRERCRIQKGPVLVVIRPPWRLGGYHAVVLCGGWVHDPQLPQGVRRDKYFRRRWTVVRLYWPEHPELLQTARLLNWADRNVTLAFPKPTDCQL